MRMFKKFNGLMFLGISVILLSLTGCLKDDSFDYVAQYDQEIAEIDKVLKEKGITPQIHEASGIRYIVHTQGTGYKAAHTTKVKVHLDELLMNGTLVESTKDKSDDPVEFSLFNNASIDGLHYAIALTKEGDSATFYIPSLFCYRDAGSGSVPANSTLIVNLKNHGIKNLSSELQAIDTYIENKQWQVNVEEDHGIRYVIHTSGDGEGIDVNDVVQLDYEGRFLSTGAIFDNTFGENNTYQFTHKVNRMINGWEIAMEELHEGDSATFFVPSQFGYGDKDRVNSVTKEVTIPKNSVLMFTVKVKNVRKVL